MGDARRAEQHSSDLNESAIKLHDFFEDSEFEVGLVEFRPNGARLPPPRARAPGPEPGTRGPGRDHLRPGLGKRGAGQLSPCWPEFGQSDLKFGILEKNHTV